MVLREVASAINALTSMEANKMEICDRAISTIIAMLLSGDTEVERHATCAVANLMENVDLHVRLLEERPGPLGGLALSDDLNTKGEASRAIANLAANVDVQQTLIKEGVLQPMVEALQAADVFASASRRCAWPTSPPPSPARSKSCRWGRSSRPIGLARNSRNQLEARRYAVLALANLSATIANHTVMLEDGALQALFSLSNPRRHEPVLREGALANPSCATANHQLMVEEGGLQPVITLAYSPDPDVHQQAAAALRGLSVSHDIKMKIVQEGALEPLTRLLTSEDIEILREVCAALNNLSLGDENKFEIAKSSATDALISHMQSEDMQIASRRRGAASRTSARWTTTSAS